MHHAKAVAPECRIDIIGLMTGEKIHEELITENEALITIEFDDYFIILQSITNKDDMSSYYRSKNGKFCDYGLSNSSEDNDGWLNLEDIKTLLSLFSHQI